MKQKKGLIVLVNEEASKELLEQIEYYEKTSNGLGLRFLEEIEESVEIIKNFPTQWPKFTSQTYKYILKNFPFSIVYCYTGNEYLEIYSYMHHSRKPSTWYDRK